MRYFGLNIVRRMHPSKKLIQFTPGTTRQHKSWILKCCLVWFSWGCFFFSLETTPLSIWQIVSQELSWMFAIKLKMEVLHFSQNLMFSRSTIKKCWRDALLNLSFSHDSNLNCLRIVWFFMNWGNMLNRENVARSSILLCKENWVKIFKN